MAAVRAAKPRADGWYHLEDFEELGFTRNHVREAMGRRLINVSVPLNERARWVLPLQPGETIESLFDPPANEASE
jgi:hypothetical protein